MTSVMEITLVRVKRGKVPNLKVSSRLVPLIAVLACSIR